jgi:hypothetical protein
MIEKRDPSNYSEQHRVYEGLIFIARAFEHLVKAGFYTDGGIGDAT